MPAPAAHYQNVMHYSAYGDISIECHVYMRHFTLYFQSGAVVKTLEKKQRNAAEFWKKSSEMLQNFGARFSITLIHFQCFELV